MKRFVFPALLVATWAVVIALFLTPEIERGFGQPHDRIEQMDQGGPGFARHRAVLISGWIFGSLLVTTFVCLLAWGSRPLEQAARAWCRRDAFFFAGWLMFEGVFTWMCWEYYLSVAKPPPIRFLGPFPAATSLLLFGMWSVPFFFIVGYVVYFRSWVFPASHAEAFTKLVAENRRTNKSVLS